MFMERARKDTDGLYYEFPAQHCIRLFVWILKILPLCNAPR